LEVRVNEDHCTAPKWVKRWHGKFVRVSIAELVMGGSVRWTDTVLNPLPGENDPFQARMRYSWEDLRRIDPRPERVGRRKRLVVTDLNNSDANSAGSCVLGNAIGVAIAKRVLRVSYAAFKRVDFSPTVRHDYEVVRNSRNVLVEVRGRFQGNGRSQALDGVAEKFAGIENFSRAFGVLVYPDTRTSRTVPDCEIVDPVGAGGYLSQEARVRLVLGYYKSFFDGQRVEIASVLGRLLEMPDNDLMVSLVQGVPALLPDLSRPIPMATFGRKSVYVSGVRYFGTDYEHWAPPPWHGAAHWAKEDGVLFWGISERVVRRLGHLGILHLLGSSGKFVSTVTVDGVYLSLFDDGILVGWAPRRGSFPLHLE
jgi:hypothetical protein